MTTHNCLAVIKQITGFVGAAGVSVLISLPAWAQLHPKFGIKDSSTDEYARIAESPQAQRQSPEEASPTNKPSTSPPNTTTPRGTTEPGSSPSDSSSPEGTIKPGIGSPSTEISPEDLQKFANAVKKLQPIQQSAQKEMAQVIQQQGLSEKRLEEIYQARKNPQVQPTTAITPEETKKFEQTTAKIEKIQQTTESKMMQVVQNENLEVQRFNQIFAAVRQNPTLLQKVQEMIRS
jgi:hypothetical protein